MSSKLIFLPMVLCTVLFSCQQPETSDDNTPAESLVNTSVFPVQPMQLVAPANLRLSYTGRTVTDSSVFYQVMSTYKGATVGFNLSVPKGEEGKAYFFSKGRISDDFLHIIQGLYGLPADSAVRFGDNVQAKLAALGALIVPDTTTHSAVSLGTESRLVFRCTAGDSAELYLDVNEKDHWIELAEKDTVYRAKLIRCLGQR